MPGCVCFTFDDFHGEAWLQASPLFLEHSGHATFFVVGEITPEKATVMKQLQEAGHTIGLHTLHHRDAIPFIHESGTELYLEEEIRPQLEACTAAGFHIRSFAYPNNRRDDASDQMLFPLFDHLRAGRGPAKKTLYYPLESLTEKSWLGGTGIGSYYDSDPSVIKAEMTHAAETDSLLVYFSHDIAPLEKVSRIGTPVEWLAEFLTYAETLQMRVAGFDELNGLKASIPPERR